MCLYTLLSGHMFVQYKRLTMRQQQKPSGSVYCKHTQPDNSTRPSSIIPHGFRSWLLQPPLCSFNLTHIYGFDIPCPNFPITSSLLKWDVRLSRENPMTTRSRRMTGGDRRPVQWGTHQVCDCHCLPLTPLPPLAPSPALPLRMRRGPNVNDN